jgi:hypothetical protein
MTTGTLRPTLCDEVMVAAVHIAHAESHWVLR